MAFGIEHLLIFIAVSVITSAEETTLAGGLGSVSGGNESSSTDAPASTHFSSSGPINTTYLGGCKDKDKSCHWHAVEGKCGDSMVLRMCPKSCGECGCEDVFKTCSKLYKYGLCERTYESQLCRRTCGLCGPKLTDGLLTTNRDCVDKDKGCHWHAMKGKCGDSFVAKYCAKSCGLCGCEDTLSKKCKRLASKELCKREYEAKVCKKSCGLCGQPKKNSATKSQSNGRSSTDRDRYSCNWIRSKVPDDVRIRFNIPKQYELYTEAYGIPIVSTTINSERALSRACYLTAFMFASRREILTRYYELKGYVLVTREDEHSGHKPSGPSKKNPVTVLSGSDLLCFKKSKDSRNDEDYAVRTFAHTIRFLLTDLDSKFRTNLIQTYNDAMQEGLWKDTYASRSYTEYFAEGIQSFLRANLASKSMKLHHNGVNSNWQLHRYDRQLYYLISDILTCKNRFMKKCKNKRENSLSTPLKQECTARTRKSGRHNRRSSRRKNTKSSRRSSKKRSSNTHGTSSKRKSTSSTEQSSSRIRKSESKKSGPQSLRGSSKTTLSHSGGKGTTRIDKRRRSNRRRSTQRGHSKSSRGTSKKRFSHRHTALLMRKITKKGESSGRGSQSNGGSSNKPSSRRQRTSSGQKSTRRSSKKPSSHTHGTSSRSKSTSSSEQSSSSIRKSESRKSVPQSHRGSSKTTLSHSGGTTRIDKRRTSNGRRSTQRGHSKSSRGRSKKRSFHRHTALLMRKITKKGESSGRGSQSNGGSSKKPSSRRQRISSGQKNTSSPKKQLSTTRKGKSSSSGSQNHRAVSEKPSPHSGGYETSSSGTLKYGYTCGYIRTKIPDHVRSRFNILDKYKLYTEAYGIPIVSKLEISNRALSRACYITAVMFASRPEFRERYTQLNGYILVVNEYDYPYHTLKHSATVPTKSKPVTTLSASNLLCLKKSKDWRQDEDYAVHTLAHTLDFLMTDIDSGFNNRLLKVYNHSIKKNRWKKTFARQSHQEYFAEGVQSYLGANLHKNSRRFGHNEVNGRSMLYQYDRILFDLISDILTCDNELIAKCKDDGINSREVHIHQGCQNKSETKIMSYRTQSDCKDKDNSCRWHAVKGKCGDSMVLRMCPKSCGECGCEDVLEKCSNFAEHGLCEKGYGSRLCRRTCGLCIQESVTHLKDNGECKDKDSGCHWHAMKGKCDDDFVARNCQKSCGFCGCEDTLPKKCRRLAQTGLCKNEYETSLCKKSCGLC